MYQPQHAHTNFWALLKFVLVAQKHQGEEIVFSFSDSKATFVHTFDDYFGYEIYQVTYGHDTILFGMDFETASAIPIRVENWLEDYRENVFVTNTDIRRAKIMTKGDQTLYDILRHIKMFKLQEEIVKVYRFYFWYHTITTDCYLKATSEEDAVKKFQQRYGTSEIISIEDCGEYDITRRYGW